MCTQANRGYLELNQKLQELPEDSPQKAEILVEGGLSFLVSAQQMAEDIAVANNQASAIIEAAKALPLFKAGLKSRSTLRVVSTSTDDVNLKFSSKWVTITRHRRNLTLRWLSERNYRSAAMPLDGPNLRDTRAAQISQGESSF